MEEPVSNARPARGRWPGRLAQRLRGNYCGAAALEFALVAPLYLLLVSASLEIGLASWFANGLDDGATRIGNYLRDQAMLREPATEAGLREAACETIASDGLNCANLKIAIFNADDPVNRPITVPTIIDDTIPAFDARGYVIALGYEWRFFLPTTKLLMIHNGDRTQIQARTFVSVAERAIR